MEEVNNVVIIGSGPAAYTAAIYAGRALLSPRLFTGFLSGPIGGQLTTTTEVENFPGFPKGILGPELMMRMQEQAEACGTVLVQEDVTAVDLGKRPFEIRSTSTVAYAHSLIIATGATAKRLDVPGAQELWQKGVSACAVCDGALPVFRNKPVLVVGGGDSAVEEALFLTKYASHVYVAHRRDKLRASAVMTQKILEKTKEQRAGEGAKVTILWNQALERLEGTSQLERAWLCDTQSGKRSSLEVSGLFFAIGHEPNTSFLGDQLAKDGNGYLITAGKSCATSVPGVFAAGDVQDHIFRQAITAAGSGCMAALEVDKWLSEKGVHA